jgi:hypothetical protein
MSDPGDTASVLHRFISDDHAERLLAGHADADDEGLTQVAGLFAALRAPSQAGELAGTDDLVARMAAAVADGAVPARPSRRKPVLAKLVTGKVAALAAVAFFSAGAAAAATGNLPDPLQRTVAKTFSHVGVDLPAPADEPISSTTSAAPTTTASASAESDSTATPTSATDATDPPNAGAVGPDATGPAKQGLCTAYFANDHGKNLDAVSFRNLTEAATTAGQTVEEFCAATSDTTTTTSSVTPTTDEHGKPTDPGNSGSTPGATAPGSDVSTPADTAPRHDGSTPADTTPASSHAP